MSASNIVAPFRPVTVSALTGALAPGVERYVVKAAGCAVFQLDQGDTLEVAPIEGGQTVEIVVFGRNGKGDAGALGLSARFAPTTLQTNLDADTPDALRVRFGLFRRGLDLGRVKAARLFAPDATAGEMQSMTAERPVTIALGVPLAPMVVWDQNPPGDVLVFIRRAVVNMERPAAPPEPLAEPRLDLTVNIASAISFEVFEGEYIQIVDVAGRQCSDFLAFQRRALDRGEVLGLDSTTTRSMTGLAYPTPGLHSKFFDRDRTPLVEVIQDTVGRHDTFNLACTSRYYEDMGYFGHANCSENFNRALESFEVGQYRGWPAINFFYNTNVDAQNVIWFDEPWSRAGDYVLMRALSDLVCGASSCPDDIDPANGWQLSEIQVRVYPKATPFKRALGRRITPESPVQITKESGFHARTSELTRSFQEYRGFWVPTCFAAEGPVAEYWACRERVVAMDLSPLRKLEIVGPGSEDFLQKVFPRDVRKMTPGQIVYTAICYPHGGMVDDGTLFRMCQNNFRWIGGDDASLLWLREKAEELGADVQLRTASDQIHNIAVQGPKSRDLLREILWTPDGRPTLDELRPFRFTIGRFGGYDGIPVLVSRTGYTGELGYEVFCHPSDAPKVWDTVMEAGEPHGIAPFGFGALDLVRIEAGLVFGGHDFDSTTDPFEAGITFTVPKSKTEDYIGRDALLRRREHPARALVGLEVKGAEVPSHGDKVFIGRAEVGIVTSAMRSPLLKKTIALARLDIAHSELGTAVEIGRLDGRLKRLSAEIVRFPFYDPEKTRVRA